MASIRKRSRDKGKRHAPYWIQYKDHTGKRRTTKAFSDKAESERLAAKLEHEAMLRRRGIIDPQQEVEAALKQAPIPQLIGGFCQHLQSNAPKHVKLTVGRVERIVHVGEMVVISDITVETVEAALVKIVDTHKIGHRTRNHYAQATDSFCNWMVATKRLPSNPLIGLRRLNVDVDLRHQRRALSQKEFGQLVESARQSGVRIQGYDGYQRARIYIFSFLSGQRRAEMGSLTRTSFNLAAEPPTVTVEAARSKHRKKDVLPLHPDLVVLLRAWLKDLGPDDHLFPGLERKKTWLMVKKDLERVGIPSKTAEGIADFHAAGRHTHITELLRSGASLPEARELARHSDIRMTMKYTHIGIEDQARALGALRAPKEWLHIGCTSGGSACHSMSSSDSGDNEESGEDPSKNPRGDGGCVVDRHNVTPDDSPGKSGGGGNRTRVPRYFGVGVYVRSRLI